MTPPVGPALLLDEMFSPVIAEQLREKGHDVLALAADPRRRAIRQLEGDPHRGHRVVAAVHRLDDRSIFGYHGCVPVPLVRELGAHRRPTRPPSSERWLTWPDRPLGRGVQPVGVGWRAAQSLASMSRMDGWAWLRYRGRVRVPLRRRLGGARRWRASRPRGCRRRGRAGRCAAPLRGGGCGPGRPRRSASRPRSRLRWTIGWHTAPRLPLPRRSRRPSRPLHRLDPQGGRTHRRPGPHRRTVRPLRRRP